LGELPALAARTAPPDIRPASASAICDRVREVCPEFPGGARPIHWSIPDPSTEPGSDAETLPAFERVADELTVRIGFLLEAIAVQTTDTEVIPHGVR
jgi:hypothetical protein